MGAHLHLQEYFVRFGCEPVVREVIYTDAERARPGRGVRDALARADRILIAPSNPFISIEPILAIPGIREALLSQRARCIAVSPIVSGRALKGPSAKMMAELGMPVCATTVARLYRDFAGCFVVDESDRDLRSKINELGTRAVSLSTVMTTLDDKIQLARELLALPLRAGEPK